MAPNANDKDHEAIYESIMARILEVRSNVPTQGRELDERISRAVSVGKWIWHIVIGALTITAFGAMWVSTIRKDVDQNIADIKDIKFELRAAKEVAEAHFESAKTTANFAKEVATNLANTVDKNRTERLSEVSTLRIEVASQRSLWDIWQERINLMWTLNRLGRSNKENYFEENKEAAPDKPIK